MSFVKATYGLQLALYFEDFLFRWAGWGQLPLKRELHLLDDMSRRRRRRATRMSSLGMTTRLAECSSVGLGIRGALSRCPRSRS